MRSTILFPILLVLILSFISLSVMADDNKRVCAEADALRDAGDLEGAKAKYIGLLKEGKSDCAIDSLAPIVKKLQERACAEADALRDAGDLEGAKAKYIGLLKEGKSDCAIDSLAPIVKKLQERACAEADALRDAGDLEGAKAKYIGLLKEGKSDCARLALKSVRQKLEEKAISRAQKLVDLGLYAEASTTLINQLEKDEKTKIPLGLQNLLNRQQIYWALIKYNAEPWIRLFLEFILIILIAIALFMLLLKYCKPLRRKLSICPPLDIEEFYDKDLKIAPIENGIGKGLSSVVRSQLEHVSAASQGFRISQIVGSIQKITIPTEVVNSIPKVPGNWWTAFVNMIPALLNWVLQPSTMKLTGHLHKPGKKGAGLTVQLLENNKIQNSYTFWQQDFDNFFKDSNETTVYNLNQLAKNVAIWLMFNTAKREFELLGTKNWKSYAYFSAGLHAESQEERLDDAKKLYINALRIDAKLSAARVNLSGIYRKEAKKEKDKGRKERLYKVAMHHLAQAKNDCENNDCEDINERNPTLYSAKYNLAVLRYNVEKDPKKANEEIKDLLKKIETVLKKIQDKEKGYKDPDRTLKNHLETIKSIADAMYGGLKVECEDKEAADEWLKNHFEEETKPSLSSVLPRYHYNLACTFSILANYPDRTTEGNKNQKEYLESSLRHLELAFLIKKELCSSAEDDPALEKVKNKMKEEYKALVNSLCPEETKELNSNQELVLNQDPKPDHGQNKN